MSKRKINKQQRARINSIQTNFQTSSLQNEENQHQGLVLSRFGHHAEIELTTNKILRCAIRPNIDDIVAGDQVICLEEGPNQGVVVCLLPRRSVLVRHTQHQSKKIIAANITQLIIVAAPLPEPNWLLIDSYLVKAENDGIQALIVFNKSDFLPSPSAPLSHAGEESKMTAPVGWIDRFHSLGYECIETSCVTGAGLALLFKKLQHQTSAFVGQSGVGKSSLIADCLPDISIAIAKSNHQHGRHTTSNARLYHLPLGGNLIDSPGIREFDLCDLSKGNILFGFKEFRSLANECRFRNCNHRDAPDCAIVRAVELGECDKSRYHSFLTLYPNH